MKHEFALSDPARERFEALASACVACGLCLPACPTFALTADETESPRGRIQLMQGLVAGELALEEVRPHLDRCLACRACEPACPSHVRYGAMLELVRDGGAVERTVTVDALLALVERPALLGAAMRAGRPLAGLAPGGLRGMARASGRTRRIRWTRRRPGAPQAAVLKGCVMRHGFADAQEAGVRLLHACGYDVVEAEGQGCCGALHLHYGRGERGAVLRERALAATPPGALLVSTAAGCGAALREAAPERVLDLTEAVARAPQPPVFRQVPGRVAVFDACHLVHAQGVQAEPRALIAALGRETVELRDAGRCCGAAGVYALQQPELSRRLRADRIAAIAEAGAEVVSCGNPGCALQLRAGLDDAGLAVQVVHPAELAAGALPPD